MTMENQFATIVPNKNGDLCIVQVGNTASHYEALSKVNTQKNLEFCEMPSVLVAKDKKDTKPLKKRGLVHIETPFEVSRVNSKNMNNPPAAKRFKTGDAFDEKRQMVLKLHAQRVHNFPTTPKRFQVGDAFDKKRSILDSTLKAKIHSQGNKTAPLEDLYCCKMAGAVDTPQKDSMKLLLAPKPQKNPIKTNKLAKLFARGVIRQKFRVLSMLHHHKNYPQDHDARSTLALNQGLR